MPSLDILKDLMKNKKYDDHVGVVKVDVDEEDIQQDGAINLIEKHGGNKIHKDWVLVQFGNKKKKPKKIPSVKDILKMMEKRQKKK